MPIKIVMPRLGWTMEEGTLVEWFKQEGEEVQAGEILFTVESDKALNEVESLDSGILHIPEGAPECGDTVPVGTLLAYLLAPGEPPPADAPPRQTEAAAPEPVQAAPGAGPGRAPRKRGQAISPRALRLAAELGVDWESLEGSGRSGRIVEQDIRAAASRKADGERLPVAPVRRRIAQRLVESVQTTAPVTLVTEADAAELVVLREHLGAAFESGVPTYNDLFLKLTALALKAHPLLNASWKGEEVVLHEDVHLGFAVDTDAGLLVPVLRQADAKSLERIAAETADLAEKARAGKLGAEEMQGGTFTVTNLGAYDIDAFTPIINLPQCAILGVGRIVEKPAVHNGQVVPRPLVTLSLTFDHRVVDGGPAACFLNTVREYVEQPDLWLMQGEKP